MKEQGQSVNESQELVIPEVKDSVLKSLDLLSSLLTENEFDLLALLIKDTKSLSTKSIRLELMLKKHYFHAPGPHKQWAYDTFKNNIGVNKKPVGVLYKEIEQKLKKNNIDVPSYETIDKLLQALEKLGIVLRRFDDTKGVKYLWSVNPNFLRAVGDRREAIRQELFNCGIEEIQSIAERYDEKMLFGIYGLNYHNITLQRRQYSTD